MQLQTQPLLFLAGYEQCALEPYWQRTKETRCTTCLPACRNGRRRGGSGGSSRAAEEKAKERRVAITFTTAHGAGGRCTI